MTNVQLQMSNECIQLKETRLFEKTMTNEGVVGGELSFKINGAKIQSWK